MPHTMTYRDYLDNAARRPLIAGGALAAIALVIAAAGALSLTAPAASADAAALPAGAVPGSVAPAGRIMGLEASGFGPDARVHTVQVDEHGRAVAYTIIRPGLFGLGARVTVEPDSVVYDPFENKIVRVPR